MTDTSTETRKRNRTSPRRPRRRGALLIAVAVAVLAGLVTWAVVVSGPGGTTKPKPTTATQRGDLTAVLRNAVVVPPTVSVGGGPIGLAFDPATHTLYTANQTDGSVSVIDTSRCSAVSAARCGQVVHSVALTPGASADAIALDTATGTAYVADNADDTIAVIDTATCNATVTTGCQQTPPTVDDPGGPVGLAVDQFTDTVYVADNGDGATGTGSGLAVIDGATCNATVRSGCSQRPSRVRAGAGPSGVAVDPATDTVYVTDAGSTDNGDTVSVLDGTDCNGARHTGCGQVPATVKVGTGPAAIALDPATHTAYTANVEDSTVSVFDTATCDGTDHSGCAAVSATVPVGAAPTAVTVDQSLHTAYVTDDDDDTLSAIDTVTCNATARSGCGRRPPTIQVGNEPEAVAADPATGTVYAANFVGNTVSVIDAGSCDAARTSGCRHEAPAVAVGAGPAGVAVDLLQHTVYVTNETADTISVLDADTCNATRTTGCRPVATIRVGSERAALGPGGIAVDEATGTAYVADQGSDTVSVINVGACNATRLTGCGQVPRQVHVGDGPSAVAVDEASDTVYVTDPGTTNTGYTVSVIDGATCNATHDAGCGQVAPTVTVGDGPLGIAVDEATDTVYVTGTGELGDSDNLGDTVSVIDGATCDGVRHSGCATTPPTVTVGTAPYGIAIDQATNTVYVADNAGGDAPAGLSVINGATCDATHVSGCSHYAPAVPGIGRAARAIALDPSTDTVYTAGHVDATVSVVDAAGDATGATPRRTAPRLAVGSQPLAMVLDTANHTLYVANSVDNTISLLAG